MDPTATSEAARYQEFVDPAAPTFNDFTTLEYGTGYQVYCKNPTGVTVTLTGKLPTQSLSQSLAIGWHLLPAISTKQSAVSEIFGEIDAESILRYDTATSSLTPATQVEPGGAYFVKVRTASTWTPPLPRDPTTRFVYDGDGGRVKQVTPAGTTTYLGEAFEKAPSGITTKYLFAGGLRLAAREIPPGPQVAKALPWWRKALHSLLAFLDVPVEAATLDGLRFYHPDHLGSSNVITDGAGAVVELSEHTPFGTLARHEGPTTARHQFTGQHQDDRTGLILFPGRVYDPELGRFLQPDPFVQNPADPQTLNRYAYVRNNPVNLVDPSGYKFWREFVAVVAGIGVALLTGNPYAGYVEYRAVKRELAHSNSPWEAAIRVVAVTAVVVTTTLVVQSFFPSEGPWSHVGQAAGAAAAEGAARVSHKALDSFFGSHQEPAQALVQDLGASVRVADIIAGELVRNTRVSVTTKSETQILTNNPFFYAEGTATTGLVANPDAERFKVNLNPQAGTQDASLTDPLGILTVSTNFTVSLKAVGGNRAFLQFVPLTFGLTRTVVVDNTFATNRVGIQPRKGALLVAAFGFGLQGGALRVGLTRLMSWLRIASAATVN